MDRNDKQLRRLFSTLFIAASLGIAFLYCFFVSFSEEKRIDPVAASCLTACLFAFVVAEELINSEEDRNERISKNRSEHERIVKDIQLFNQTVTERGSQE